MNKKWIIKETMVLLSIMLCLNIFAAGTGFAKNDDKKAESSKGNNNSNNNNSGSNNSEKSDKSIKDEKSNKVDDHSKTSVTSDVYKQHEPNNSEKSDKSNKDDKTNKNDDHSDSSVTSDVYKHHKQKTPEKVVPKGLMIAYLKAKGTSAQAVIGDLLLNKYSISEIVYSFKNGLGKGKLTVTGNVYGGTSGTGTIGGTIKVIGSDDSSVTGAVYDLSAEFVHNFAKELLEQLKVSSQTTLEKADALEQLSDVYDNIGDNEIAIEVQKDAIKTNPFNLQSYQKLGQLVKTEDKKAIKGFVNGEQVTFDVLPVIQNARTLVPFRAISESLKAEVIWNAADKTVTVTKNGVVVKLTIGSKTALVNGKEVALDTPAQLIKDRTLIPVRFLSEAFSADVQWEPNTQSVVVNETK